MNRLHIELEAEVWKNYPYHCPYCLSCPCECKEKGYRTREFASNETQKPRTLEEFQAMYQKIYPAQNRTLDHAGVHLAEEIGEFSEAILKYRGGHNDAHFEGIKTEAADVFSNLVAVFNSLGISIAQEIAIMFSENCHICHKTPCECDYEFVVNYRS